MTVDDNTGTPTGPSDDDAQPVEPTLPVEPAVEPTPAVEPVPAEPVAVEPPAVAPADPAPVDPAPVDPAPVAPSEPAFDEPTPEQFASEDDDEELAVAAAGGALIGAGAVARSAQSAGSVGSTKVKTTEAKPSRSPLGLLKARIARIATFYRQVAAELRKVIWPTRKELITYTSVVLVFVFVMVTIVGVFDFAFGQAVIKIFGA